MPSTTHLTPKPPPLLRVSESQAISNSSSFVSSSSSSLFDRMSGASSACLTDLSSPITPSTAEFGGELDSHTKEQASLPSWGRHDRAFFSPPSRLPRLKNVSLVNQSTRLDQASSLGLRSSARSYTQSGTPFLSLIPIAVGTGEERRYHPDSEDTFDAVSILRNRLERGNPTVATRRALEIMDPDGHPPAACRKESVGIAGEAPTVVVTGPDSPVEDWSDDFELGGARGVNVSSPDIPDAPSSPSILGTPGLGSNWDSCSSLSTVMAESPQSSISSPADMSIDEDEVARLMHMFVSIPTRSSRPFTGAPQGDVDANTVMRLEVASTIPADPSQPQTKTVIGLGVAMPAVYPPLPPTLFPYHHAPGTTLNSRSLQELGYQTFDDKMFEIEQKMLSKSSSDKGGLGADFKASLSAPTPPFSELDFECYDDAFAVEQELSLAHTSLHHTGGHDLVSADEAVTTEEVALLPMSNFYRQVQNSRIFEPLVAQKRIELDASQLKKQSALTRLERGDLLLERIFSHSPPIQTESRSEAERQDLARLSETKSYYPSESQPHIHNLLFSSPVLSLRKEYCDPCIPTTDKLVEVELPAPSVKHLAVSDKRSKFSMKSLKALKKLGLERLAIFQPRSGRKDLDQTSPTVVTPQDDPRSPYQSTMDGVFSTFASINPPAEMHSAMKSATASIGLGTKHSSMAESLSFGPKRSTVQRIESSNQFLKPSHFPPRPLYDIVEVPTPPSSKFSSPCGTLTEVEVTKVVPLSEVPMTPIVPRRPGFKRLVSKFARDLFKRPRSIKKGGLESSPVLIEHADAWQDNRGKGFSSSVHKIQLLF